jgi:uncharacterized protein YjiS (DUF1127 family)
MKAETHKGDLAMNGSCCTLDTTAPAALATLAQRRRMHGTLVETAERLWRWYDRARSRRALMGMDDRMLRDIGIDRATAQYEGTRPFWR